MGETEEKFVSHPDTKIWYESLELPAKRKVFEEAIKKFPYLSDMMRMSNVRASDPNFTNHFTFKLFTDIVFG